MSNATLELHNPLHGFRRSGCALPQGGSALVILCPFTIKEPRIRGRIYRNTVGALHSFWYQRLLYAANPRAPEYQAGYVAMLLQQQKMQADVLIIGEGAADLYPEIPGASSSVVQTLKLNEAKGFADKYDHVIISYADPLGLGYGSMEALLLQDSTLNAHILNGRGRIFPLTGRVHRLMQRHRFFARTRIAECFFGVTVLPLACLLALYDTVCKKMRSRHA